MDTKKKEELTNLINCVRLAVSCCCSWHRYDEITKLCDDMEALLEEDNNNEDDNL